MSKRTLAVPLGFTIFFLWVTTNLIFTRDGDLYSGQANVWGDFAAHFAYTAHFAFKPVDLWFSTNPIFAGGKLHYPFLINLFSSLLVRMGMDIGTSLKVTSFLAMSGAVWLLYFFFRRITGRGGLSLILIFLGGSLGWTIYLRDLFTNGNFFDNLLFPPLEYGHLNDLGLSVGGTLSCLWFPQRGLPLAVIAATPLFMVLASETASRRAKQVAVGLLAGLLPIIHVHTLVCVTTLVGCFIVDKRKSALPYWPALLSFILTAAFFWIAYHHDSPGTSFLTWQPWWLASHPNTPANRMGWLVFWIWNWSIFLPLVIAAGIWAKPLRARFVILAGVVLFLVANFVRFQPWDWDNTKILFWAYVFMLPAVIQLFEKLRSIKHGKLLVRACVLLTVATGCLDALRLFSPSRTSYLFFSKKEQAWAERLREKIPPDAVVLSSNDAHDWVVSLAGRQVVMGYPGWLWSYGLPATEREQELRDYIKHESWSIDFLAKHRVTHIALDRKMRTAYAMTDYERFAGLPVVWQEPELTVYAIPPKPVEPPR